MTDKELLELAAEQQVRALLATQPAAKQGDDDARMAN